MKKVCSSIVTVLLFISFLGCVRNEYPDVIAEYWYCNELDFTLNVAGKKSELEWKEKQYGVVLGFRPGGYDVFVENGDGAVTQDEILFRGSWSYKQGNLVLQISDDRLFCGAYKELIFVPTEIDSVR